MNVYYMVDGAPGALLMPATYLLHARAEDLAELVASDHWRGQAKPPAVCEVRLLSVDGVDLGVFEVQSVTRPVFTARAVARG